MLEGWRKKRALRKVRPGDGKALRPMRPWQMLYRTVFHIDLLDRGASHTFTVSVPFFDLDGTVHLFRNGRRHAVAPTPAVFPVPGGVIEATMSTFGLSRMHFVADDGVERQLLPDRASAEGLRARFGHRFPAASRAVAGIAIAVLLVGLVAGLPQIIEQVTQIGWVAENAGTFTSPVTLSPWANSALFAAGLLAAFERALTLRNHWLVDLDTWFLGP